MAAALLRTLIMLFVVAVPAAAQNAVTIKGTVRDSATGEELRFVTVRALHARVATMSTRTGEYTLRIAGPKLVRARETSPSDTVVFSVVGYHSDTIVVSYADSQLNVVLAESQLRTREVVVSAEDPGERIMRKVLERKAEQMKKLDRYTYMLYTKFVATTDTATAMRSTGRGDSTVFSILESYSKGYVDRPDRYFNEIVQRRQTVNIPPQANFVAFGTNLNIFDDELSLLGEVIETPFHPDALDDYEFELTSNEEDAIVRIEARPRNNTFRAFHGTIYIDQRNHRPLDVQLRPNEAVNLPFDAGLYVRQTFIDTMGYVMPEALSIQSSVKADILFIFSPRLDIDLETFCYDYDFATPFDDDVFEQRRVEIAEGAQTYDTTFWTQNMKMPLRPEEEFAYEEIRRFQENPDSVEGSFLDRYIGPVTRTIARLGREPFSGFEDVFRYNNIHGPYLGLGLWFRPDTVVEIRAAAGYGFMNERVYASGKATYFIGHLQKWSVDGGAYSSLLRRDDPNTVKAPLITLTSLLFGDDYGDYYHAEGWEAGVAYSWGQLRFTRNNRFARPSMIRAFIRSERQTSAPSVAPWSLFTDGKPQRQNPDIMPGSMQSVGGELFLNYRPERAIARTGMVMRGEVSDPMILPTDFTYARAEWTGFARMKTLPLWTLDLYASVGATWGDVPPQRFFSLESAISGIAVGSAFRGMGVKEFYGDRYAAFSLQHNFGELIPGFLRIPNIASFGIEFIAFGSVGYTTFSDRTIAFTKTVLPTTSATSDNVYYEAGLGINRLLLFFRIDVNTRWSQRNTPDWRVTISSATF